MKDADIRQALHLTEFRQICLEHPETLVVDEFCLLEGKFRIDVAVVNSCLHGYEIKSAADTLDRLPAQQESYDRVFDRVTLVADQRHVEQAVKMVPPHWGLIAVSADSGVPVLNEIWPARQNYNIDPLALSQLLWREEALGILALKGLDRGLRTKARRYLWEALARQVEVDELRELLRLALKSRTDWRNGSRPRRRRRRRRRRLA